MSIARGLETITTLVSSSSTSLVPMTFSALLFKIAAGLGPYLPACPACPTDTWRILAEVMLQNTRIIRHINVYDRL